MVFALLLLASCLHVGFSDKVSWDWRSELNSINDERARYARIYSVTNMHKLQWSDELAEIADSLNEPTWPDARITWRYVRYIETDVKRGIEDFVLKLRKMKKIDRENEYKRPSYSHYFLEYLVPRQKFIGCAKKSDETPSDKLCLVGPEGKFHLFDLEPPIDQRIASKCDKHYHTIGEMCWSVSGSDSYLGYQSDFIEEVNEMRREYAKVYGIANMHELTWSDELVDIAKPLIWNENWPDKLKTWRFTSLRMYYGVADRAKEYMDKFNKTKPSQYLKDHKGDTFEYLEFLDPSQKFVGCVQKKKDYDYFLCLLGPKGKMDVRSLRPLPKQEPGSKCVGRYRNKDGLCSLSGSDSYSGSFANFLEDVNFWRQKYANEKNIPNMHELKSSNELERMASSGDSRSMRNIEIPIYSDIIDMLDSAIDDVKSKSESEQNKFFSGKSHGLLELASPHQKFIGCIETSSDPKSFKCYLGPRIVFNSLALRRLQNSRPGTQCSSGYENQNGLCSPKDSSKVSLFGNFDYFLSDLNVLRRRYAKKYNVPHMHLLTYDKDLEKIAENLETPSALKTYNSSRFSHGSTYNQLIESIQTTMSDTRSKGKGYWDDLVGNRYNERTHGYLEYLVPKQTVIGCAKKDSEVLCLLGIKRDLHFWDYNPLGRQFLGSWCSHKPNTVDGKVPYIHDGNGLCVLPEDLRNSSKFSFMGHPDLLLDDINEWRKEHARTFFVPNMHKLMYSEQLSEIARNLSWGSRPWNHLNNKNWRYLRFKHFHNPRHLMLRELKDYTFAGHEAQDKKRYLEATYKEDTYEKENGFLLCLVGPESEFKIFPTKITHLRRPGTKCSHEYVNGEGLCVLKPEPKSHWTTTSATPTTTTTVYESVEPEESTTPTSSGASNNFLVIIFLFFYRFIVLILHN